MARAATNEFACERANAVLGEWRGRGRVVVFAAGMHTMKILPVLERHADRVAGIADDSPARTGHRVGRWIVQPLAELIDETITGILISTDVQQDAILARLKSEYTGRCALLTLYPKSDSTHTDGAPLLAFTGERQIGSTIEEIELGHRARYYWALQRLFHDARVLDAACGNGYGSRILADGGCHVFGIDISPEAIAFARHHFAHPNISHAIAPIDDGRSLAHAAGKHAPFDAAVSLETIEHVDDAVALLRALRELLKPGGLLLCSTPNAAVVPLEQSAFHRRHYTIEEMSGLLRDTGFMGVEWFGQEGLQILPQRALPTQRFCLFVARRA
ncbi:MAG: class I SAM-dependent methyltransferase [Planctomycetes bacterium]|nr:class I SAM-dependent methyltransferase [Planctomycetota bacterium]